MFAFSMSLALVFTFGVLAFMLTVSLSLALVLTGRLTLAFMLSICVALALVFTFGVLAFMLTVSLSLALVFTGSLALAFMFAVCSALAFMLGICMSLTFVLAFSVLTLVLRSSGFLGMATGSAVLATCGQFLAGSRIGLHGIGIVAQFADLLTQLVGSGLLGIVIDRDLCRVGIIGVVFHTLEERNIVFETVNAFLTFERGIGLNGDGLHLCISAQRHYGHQGQQD